MTIIDKIIKGDIAPENTNVLWLNTEDNIIYVFSNGWIKTSTGAAASVYTGTEAERLAIEDPFNGLEFHQVDENGKVTRYLYEEDTWRVVVELTPEDAEYYHELATEDHQKAVADHQNAIDDHAQYLVDHESIAHKANVDGYYGQMTVGAAENLVGDSEETYTFTTQMTGGEVEFGSGAGQLTKVQGNGLAWNQLVKNGNFVGITNWSEFGVTTTTSDNIASVSAAENGDNRLQQSIQMVVGHKFYFSCWTKGATANSTVLYLFYGSGSDSTSRKQNDPSVWEHKTAIFTRNEGVYQQIRLQNSVGGTTNQYKNVVLYDLSLIYGLGNEPTTVEQFEADLAKLITQKPYYQPNAGELFGTKVLHLISYGQNLLNPSNGQARLAPYSYESIVNKYGIAAKADVTLGTITFTPDATGVAETITPDSNGQFTISGAGTLSVAVSAGNLSDVYVCAVYDGAKDGIDNFVPFQQDAVEIKASEIYGKLNGTGEYVQVFADGVMRGAGSAHDVIDLQSMTADVNMGKITMPSSDSGAYGVNAVSGLSRVVYYYANDTSVFKPKSKYLCNLFANGVERAYCIENTIQSGLNRMWFYFPTDVVSSVADVLTYFSNHITNVWYERATPLHYTDLKLSSDGGETFRDLPSSIVVDNWGVWEQKPSEGLTPVTGHDFEGIAATISTILPMDAVEILKSVQDNGIMTADQRAQLTSILTALQTAGIIGSFTIAETPTDKVFPITITAPVEPEP